MQKENIIRNLYNNVKIKYFLQKSYETVEEL